MKDRITRRTMLNQTGAAIAGTALAAVSRQTAGQPITQGANQRVGLGIIGCGNRGKELLNLALTVDNVTVPIVCDVDSRRAGEAADLVVQAGHRKPAVVADYRKVLDKKDVEGVIIATPDHWHAIQHITACAAEKDVYLETPISHNVVESQMMRIATRKKRRVVQVGLQLRSAPWHQELVKQIQTGILGKIAQTRSWTFAKVKPIKKIPDTDPPSHLDFERWLGPAAMREYNPNRVHAHFANWWDYSGGTIYQWNPHMMELMHSAMRTNVPKSAVAVGGNQGLQDFRETPDTLEAIFEYDGPRGSFMHIYSLRLSNGHAAWGPPIPPHNGQLATGETLHYGVQFHGNEATLFADHNGPVTMAAQFGQDKSIPHPGQDATALQEILTLNHLNDFIVCIQTRAEPKASIEYGVYALLPCQLANISYRIGKKIYFDSIGYKCYLDAEHKQEAREAAPLIAREYRPPYYLPPIS